MAIATVLRALTFPLRRLSQNVRCATSASLCTLTINLGGEMRRSQSVNCEPDLQPAPYTNLWFRWNSTKEMMSTALSPLLAPFSFCVCSCSREKMANFSRKEGSIFLADCS